MPVEVTGVPVDIAAISHPDDGTASPPVVAGRPIAKQLTGLAANPTPASEQKSYLSLIVGSGFQGLVPLIILSSYHRGEWSTEYCEETGLANWVFVFAWVGMGAVLYQALTLTLTLTLTLSQGPRTLRRAARGARPNQLAYYTRTYLLHFLT